MDTSSLPTSFGASKYSQRDEGSNAGQSSSAGPIRHDRNGSNRGGSGVAAGARGFRGGVTGGGRGGSDRGRETGRGGRGQSRGGGGRGRGRGGGAGGSGGVGHGSRRGIGPGNFQFVTEADLNPTPPKPGVYLSERMAQDPWAPLLKLNKGKAKATPGDEQVEDAMDTDLSAAAAIDAEEMNDVDLDLDDNLLDPELGTLDADQQRDKPPIQDSSGTDVKLDIRNEEAIDAGDGDEDIL